MLTFRQGLKDGISIALGYLSVSFSFGILAIQSGLTVWEAVLISLTNLTSAGQVAGVNLIGVQAAYFEIFLTELVINIRYALMSLVLSQKADQSFSSAKRAAASCGITDEIFAVASIQKEGLRPKYMAGLILLPYIGWTGGTWLGATAGSLLPEQITNALGIALYGMFLAIIVPPARKSRPILFVVACAALISILLHFLVPQLTGGFTMIIASVVAAALGAIRYPIPDEKEVSAS